ncbi:MAG: hypothetical protein IT428_00320 [Planctomycetaceae bacterium]|nr:hypothetical protein [Planctomycetaceae bacterium]
MREDVRRGRRIISRLAALHFVITALIAFFSYRRGSPVTNVVLRALSQGYLIHSLWKGSRFSQWMHVAGCFGWAVLALALGAKRPSPVMWCVCGGIATFWLWMAWLLGFSPSVRAFLASQRGELAETADLCEPIEGRVRADEGVPSQRLAESEPSWLESDGLVACARCDNRMKSFVVVCPACGTRRRSD